MLNFGKAEAAAKQESERHKEFIEALVARRGKKSADAYRRMAELLWLSKNIVPPEEVVLNHSEHILPTLDAIQDKMIELLSSALIVWLEAVEGREIPEEEVKTLVTKEVETILDSIQASETTIYNAAK